MTKLSLTADRLRSLFDYNQKTGEFTRLVAISNTKEGDKAGWINGNGYLRITVDKRHYFAHRLAWLYVYGVWPASQIDHVSGRRDDNRWCNLREATNSENNQNKIAPNKNNKSGYLGVIWADHANMWRANIYARGKRVHIGYFRTKEEASSAYLQAKSVLHPFGKLS